MAERVTSPLEGSTLYGHRERLIRQARGSMSQADAEEIADQVLFEGFRTRDRYDPNVASEATWLRGIAAKLIARHHRGRARLRRALTQLAVESPEPSPEESVIGRLEAVAVLAATVSVLSQLPDVDVDLVLNSAGALLGGYSTGLAVNERVRLHRIRRRLRSTFPAELESAAGHPPACNIRATTVRESAVVAGRGGEQIVVLTCGDGLPTEVVRMALSN